jgi:hypothetical protein
MTTLTVDSPVPVEPRRHHILRAVLIGITLSALIFAVLWANGPGRRWTQPLAAVFGDPGVVLADGVTLPDAPATATAWTAAPTLFGIPDDLTRVEAAFGTPAVLAKPGVIATPTGTLTYTETDSPEVAAVYGTSTVLQFVGPDLARKPDAKTFPGHAAKRGEAARVWAALGLPGTPVVDVDDLSQSTALAYAALPPNLSNSQDGLSAEGGLLSLHFGSDDTLRVVNIAPQALTDPVTVPVISAAQALDDIRHHAPNARVDTTVVPTFDQFLPWLSESSQPIRTVTLTNVVWAGRSHLVWAFLTGPDGGAVGYAAAIPGDVIE